MLRASNFLNVGSSKKLFDLLKTKEFWLIFSITFLAAFLRFYRLRELMVFLGDEGRDALLVKRLIVDHDPILVGPTTSVGKIHLPPLYYYFMAPWLILSGLDPIGPAIGVALLGTLTVPLLYFFSKNLLGKRAAFFTTVLYSVSHVAISNTRFSWNPNPMPLVSLFLIYCIYKIWQKQSFKAAVGVFFFLGLCLQLHYMVLILTPFIVFFMSLAFWKARTNPAKLKNLFLANLLGFLVLLVLLSPLLIFDLKHNLINFYGLKEFFVKGHHTNANILKIIKDIQGRSYQVIGNILGLPANLWRNAITWVIIIAFFGSVYFAKKRKKQLLFLACLLITTIVGLALYEGDVYPHYIGFVFPLPFIIVGYGLSLLWQKRLGKIVSLVVLIGLSVINIYKSPIFFKKGWNVDDVKSLARQIAQKCPKRGYNVVLVDATKDYRAMNYRYFLEILGCPPLSTENYPEAEILYVISPDKIGDFEALNMWEIKSLGELEVLEEKKAEGEPWVYKLIKNSK